MRLIDLFILGVFIMCTGCSSLPNKRILQNMAIGAATGVLIAQSKDKNRAAYTVMYAGTGASIAAALTAVTDPEVENLKSENRKLESKLSDFQKRYAPKEVAGGNNLFSSAMPKELSHIIEPGEWKRYKMDEWVQDQNQSNTWYRQVEMLEIIPPTPR